MNPGPQPGPTPVRAWLLALLGPVVTLAFAAGAELLRPTPMHFPGPGVLLLVAVAWSAYAGGFVPGLVSAAIATGYAFHYYAGPPDGVTADEFRRILDLGLAAVALVFMLGTLRRAAERARRIAAEAAVENEYREVFEEAADPIFLADATGRYVFVNRRACEMSGYTREELLRMRVGELFGGGPGGTRLTAALAPRASTRQHIEVDLVRRDGSRLHADLSVRRLADGRTLKIVRDVTEQRASLERLQGALSLVRATLESTTDGILVVDHNGKWVGHNRKFHEIWRNPPEIEHADDDERALAYVVSQLADPESFIARVRELYSTPEASSHDEIRLRDGRVLERYSIPQRIGERTIGRVWSFRDVTDQHRQAAALRETEHRFIQTEKLEAVGRLAGGVAHDFNNMLTAILGEADLLLLQGSLEERARAQVENIRSAALRSARLTRQLLAFARRQHTAPRPFALSEVLEGLDPLIRRLAGRQVDVSIDLPKDGAGPWVNADPSQFEQAILNLVINAGDAMPDGGSLRLYVCREEITAADAVRRGAPAAGVYGCVCVEDTGTGISNEVRPHLFEPFFTTKPPGKGTGLGLASVHGIVQQANGFVEVHSELGAGTSFHVLMPEHTTGQADAAAPADGAAVAGARPSESVLVVDDEEHVRGFVVAVLAQAGYTVLQADCGASAREIAEMQGQAIDLLVTDVLMPDVSGPALARELVGDGRVRRVIFMSGYPGRALEGGLDGLGSAVMVHKPFRAEELLDRVRASLDGSGVPQEG